MMVALHGMWQGMRCLDTVVRSNGSQIRRTNLRGSGQPARAPGAEAAPQWGPDAGGLRSSWRALSLAAQLISTRASRAGPANGSTHSETRVTCCGGRTCATPRPGWPNRATVSSISRDSGNHHPRPTCQASPEPAHLNGSRLVTIFFTLLKDGPAGCLRPPSDPATTHRSPANRPHPSIT
jgi:hypothetical protein